MTTHRDFKRVVRARMAKTGESYTAARAGLLRRPTTASRPVRPAAAPVPDAELLPPNAVVLPADYARLGGMSDAALKNKTGCTWEKWVKSLDHVKAYNWPHGRIAEYLSETYQVPAWWTQTLTVGYERIKGLRDVGQRRGGTYEASRSRTFAVSLTKLFGAFSVAKQRAAWLDAPDVVVRKATKNRSLRITWHDGTSVLAWFASRGRSRASVAVQHTGLADRAAVDRSKAWWSDALDRLAAHLGIQRSSNA